MTNTIHYTDEEKIKRLTAWHESEKREIIEKAARIAALEAQNKRLVEALESIGDKAEEAQGEWVLVSALYAPEWTATYKEIESVVDDLLAEVTK